MVSYGQELGFQAMSKQHPLKDFKQGELPKMSEGQALLDWGQGGS